MEKIYLSYQVKMMMPGDMYKVMDTLFAFQKEGQISYSKRNCEFLHLDQSVVEQAIQTAINYKLIKPVEMAGGIYRFDINSTVLEASKLIELKDVPTKPLFKLADEIKFKNEMGRKGVESSMTTEQMLAQIQILQSMIKRKMEEPENNADSDLPW